MIRIVLPALMLGLALASIEPADACHRFHVWHYPQAQRCGASPVRLADARIWTVEITKVPPSAPLEADQRTPEQIQDFVEHEIALAKHHDEINGLMILLHAQEDAMRAAGMMR